MYLPGGNTFQGAWWAYTKKLQDHLASTACGGNVRILFAIFFVLNVVFKFCQPSNIHEKCDPSCESHAKIFIFTKIKCNSPGKITCVNQRCNSILYFDVVVQHYNRLRHTTAQCNTLQQLELNTNVTVLRESHLSIDNVIWHCNST